MTRSMTATEVKAKILAVLDEVAAGAEVEIPPRRANTPSGHGSRTGGWAWVPNRRR